jgi:ribosomal-protein-alanine N-acetyltransferase
MILFETPRLLVRNLKSSDFPAFHALQSDPVVMRYVTGNTLNAEENQRDLQRLIELYSAEDTEFTVWAIALGETDTFIGICVLIHRDAGEYEIGYSLLQRHWKRGYGRETVQGLVKFAFSIEEITSLVAYTARENTASASVLEAAGFRRTGEKYNEIYHCIDLIYQLDKSAFSPATS